MSGAHAAPVEFDLASGDVRSLNRSLHGVAPDGAGGDDGVAGAAPHWRIRNPGGRHALCVGMQAEADLEVFGHVGYYCGGMNRAARIVVHGNAGPGVAENMMSGSVRVKGNASQSAGASGRGGLLVIEGNASARCGISMKGIDVVVAGSVGHMSAFMAQAGRLVVCGDAGADLGDSIYEAALFVRGSVASLGADCIEEGDDGGARRWARAPAGRGRRGRRGEVVPALRLGPAALPLPCGSGGRVLNAPRAAGWGAVRRDVCRAG